MGIEVVTVSAGGGSYTAFKYVSVRTAFNEAARSFEFEVAAEAGDDATNAIFAAGTPITISVNGDLLLTGYVDRKQPHIEKDKRCITVSGRSKSADFVDGAAEHDTGHFANKTPLEIAKEISSEYEPQWESDQQLDKIEQYQITPPETVFRCIEKMCRQQGMTVTGTAEGNARISKASGSGRQSSGLIEGQNIKVGDADHNHSNRHSKYTVRGQRPFDHGVQALEIEAVVNDSGVNRHRPVIIVQDEDTTKDRAKKRATNRRDRAAGNALKATIQTQGFHDEGGQLWTPGNLVWVESPFLDITQDMLIEAVSYRQDEGGSIATLSLVDPRAYGGAGGKGNKSGTEWSFDDSDAE